MSARCAVMDLGTNTFHLLIAEKVNNTICELVHRIEPVKLGEGGINKGFIQPEPFERGINMMVSFAQDIEKTGATQVWAIATSAIRNASNGPEFIRAVKEASGIQVEMINGLQEATFIYKGIRAAGCMNNNPSLIIDIGGGSVEFIIADDEQITWKQSFEIGAARMMDQFHQNDPLDANKLHELHTWLGKHLQPLFSAAKSIKLNRMIGSSGAFETFAEMIELKKAAMFDIRKLKAYTFDFDELIGVTGILRNSTHQERLQMKGIIPLRIDMIVTASVLTRFVIEQLGITEILMSTNSLKEGALAEMLEEV